MIHPTNKAERRALTLKKRKQKMSVKDGMIDPELKMLSVPLKKKKIREEVILTDYEEKTQL